MPQSKTRNLSQDRKRVAGGQYHEVAYMREKYGITPQQLSGAIKAVGNDRKKIEEYLKQKKG